MTLAEFQELAARTSGQDRSKKLHYLTISALGIAGEAGEVADLIKKEVGHGQTYDETKFVKELGDVLWYVADLCTLRGISLEEVARVNIEKLRKRYPDGFTTAASVARVDERPAVRTTRKK